MHSFELIIELKFNFLIVFAPWIYWLSYFGFGFDQKCSYAYLSLIFHYCISTLFDPLL